MMLIFIVLFNGYHATYDVQTNGSMAAATMKRSQTAASVCVNAEKKCFMSAFEVGRAPTRTFRPTRITATATIAATVCVSVVADGDCDGGD